jgi:hypothetical protein
VDPLVGAAAEAAGPPGGPYSKRPRIGEGGG